jgi:hypothetical protein
MRSVILADPGVLEKRVNNVPLETCISIIEEFLFEEEENKKLLNFETVIIKNGAETRSSFNSAHRAFSHMDLEIGLFEKDPTVVAAVYQAGRLIRGFINGKTVS